jgi:hypothetical protein
MSLTPLHYLKQQHPEGSFLKAVSIHALYFCRSLVLLLFPFLVLFCVRGIMGKGSASKQLSFHEKEIRQAIQLRHVARKLHVAITNQHGPHF